MSKEFVSEDVSKIVVSVYTNKDGNIIQENETPAAKKNFTFSGFAASITADEAINTENSPAIHNGVSGLIWLFTGQDDNFDENFKKISVETMEDV